MDIASKIPVVEGGPARSGVLGAELQNSGGAARSRYSGKYLK